MPLKGIPSIITPELLYALARMGHGDHLVICDSNFPSDSVASNCVINTPIRVNASTSVLLDKILLLMPLDEYEPYPVVVMDRVQSDKDKNLPVVAYGNINNVVPNTKLRYCERYDFYELSKKSFCVVQTDDCLPYANIIVYKGVVTSA